MTLVWIAVAWTAGILLAFWMGLSAPVLALGSIWALGAAVIERRHPANLRFAALAIAALAGAWRWHAALPSTRPGDLAAYNDVGQVVVEGHISAAPVLRSTRTQLTITAESVMLDDTENAVRGKLLLTTSPYPSRAYGDRVRLVGSLETPPVLEDFDYREYLASQGVHSIMRWATIEPLPGTSGSPVLRVLYNAKGRLRHRIESILPQPEAGLLQGILLGLDHTLPGEMSEAFRVAGLTHIIVVSGYNVSILLQAWFIATRRLIHRWASLVAGILLIALFVAFIGPSPPVVRAALMGGLFVLAQLVGRRAFPLASLAATALIMTAANPLLVRSVSYQLSFASTLALILLEPRLAAGLHGWLYGNNPSTAPPWSQMIWEVLLTTCAAQLATLPIIWANFGEVSLVALLANALVLPIQPLILVPGALVTLVAIAFPAVGHLLGYLLWVPLRWTVLVARACSAIPWAAVPVPRLPEWAAWGFYAFLLVLVIKRAAQTRRATRKEPLSLRPFAPLLLMAVCAALVWAAVFSLPDGRLRIYALDVGQGDALLIRSPQGHVIIVDGGPDPILLGTRLGQALPFWQRRIDLIIVSHEHSDHLAGLVPLTDRFDIGSVVQSEVWGSSLLSREWHRRLRDEGLTHVIVHRDTEIYLGDVRMAVLHPAAGAAHNTFNEDENSLVFALEYDTFRMLFTGDIGSITEIPLIARYPDLASTVLKVPHHGSGGSSTEAFLAAVEPRYAVISVGHGNSFGHPAESVLQRLENQNASILRTDVHGTVALTTDGRQLWIRTDREMSNIP